MKASVNQEYVETAPLLIIVCSNTSRSVGRYGSRGREFYSIIDGAFASMLILLSAVNEGIGACFVGAFQDNKVLLISRAFLTVIMFFPVYLFLPFPFCFFTPFLYYKV
jgi:nitroreductase